MAPPAVGVESEPRALERELVEAAAGAVPAKLRFHGDVDLAAKAPANADVPALTELKKKIPAHCFSSSLTTSVLYVLRDALIISSMYVAAFYAKRHLPPVVHNLAFLPAFWFFQGFMFWAVFVLGHDCGHGSFSRYPMVNSVFGHFLHSIILVPFHSWRLSHRKHHKNTGNFEQDEIFYPIKDSDVDRKDVISKLVVEELGFLLPLGYPLYLLKGYGHQFVNHSHIDPKSDLFADTERTMVRNSVICWWSMIAFLTGLGFKYGPMIVAVYYVVPYLVYCFWLLMVTFLHHTEPGAVWYNTDNWNYVKGNLQSIDRRYGILEHFHHDIGTHVVHHLFPAIPHYHLREANAALKPHLGDMHRENFKSPLPAFAESYDAWRKSYIIPADTDVFVIPPVDSRKSQ